MAVDDLTGTYEFYMDHLADYETLLKEEPKRKNLSIAPKRKSFLEDRNPEKKIILSKKKLSLPAIQQTDKSREQSKSFLQKKVHRYG